VEAEVTTGTAGAGVPATALVDALLGAMVFAFQ